MSTPKEECFSLLESHGINKISSIDFKVNEELHSLTFEYIINTYMQASETSQYVFVSALKKALTAQNMGIEKFFEGMGQLLLMTHLSDKLQ